MTENRNNRVVSCLKNNIWDLTSLVLQLDLTFAERVQHLLGGSDASAGRVDRLDQSYLT